MYKYFYDMTPDRLEDGDWMAVQVKAMIVERPDGKKFYRLYRVQPFVGNGFDPPQGQRIYPKEQEKAVAKALFPAALYGMDPDPF